MGQAVFYLRHTDYLLIYSFDTNYSHYYLSSKPTHYIFEIRRRLEY